MNIFDIQNLKCSYNGGSPVLEVEQLTIPRAKLVVIVGVSGAGKSTLLETLGMMNNTLKEKSSIHFKPNKEENYRLEDLWGNEKKSNIHEVRRHHFSFIFQNTNLMPNFTVYENICLTQMLQGKSAKESETTAKVFMKQLGLEEIDKNKNSYEISGGQAQRVAFVRAITPEFSVLFGDEPTGNLDEKNSWDLMTMLKEKVDEWKKTAIIVSHNIELALAFADQIILITKPNNHGTIEPHHVFTKKEDNETWTNGIETFNKEMMGAYLKDASEVN